ncbi:MAG: DUF308 domain-containing protein [Lachnospiraceae bacterium]|nr:DUF308 domain-containing protein [Lachnospiraceae bacterium]
MLFESLDKIRRGTLLSAILLIALGLVILICPVAYIDSLILAFGYGLVIICIVMLLEFFTNKNMLVEYMNLVIALALGIVGLCVLIFRDDVMTTLAWLSSFLLLLHGVLTLRYSLTYARRSGKKSWWVFTLLAILLIACAIILFFNPWWNTPDMLAKVIGIAVFFSAAVSIIRLIWAWPKSVTEDTKGGEDRGDRS